MIRRVLASVVFLAAFSVASVASAGLYFAGNTHPTDVAVPKLESVVNFAVITNDGGPGGLLASYPSLPASPWATFDNTASFLYLFQMVNIGPEPITNTSMEIVSGSLTSAGTIVDKGFEFLGTPISVGSPSLGPLAAAGDLSPASLVGAGDLPSVILTSIIGTGQAPISVGEFGADGKFRAIFSSMGVGSALPAGARSYVFGFTSNLAPVVGRIATIDGKSADGTVPSTKGEGNIPFVPEPGSMLVWGLGAGLVGAVGFFKRRRKVA